MSSNMDSDDKSFFMKMFEKIENHLEKTCDELHEVDKNVIGLQSDFRNHIENTNKDKEDSDKKHVHKREWLLVAITSLAVILAAVAILK